MVMSTISTTSAPFLDAALDGGRPGLGLLVARLRVVIVTALSPRPEGKILLMMWR
jgi:hypothetical protein